MTEWIDVKLELPIKTSAYLIANNNGGVWIGFWIGSKWLDDDVEDLNIETSQVTHWKEIPPPP